MSQSPVSADPILQELEPALTGRYTLERELGRGAMGAVFLARDLALDRQVAIKVLPPELAVRPELRERFLRETRTAASFSHPNIVPVHAVEQTGSLLLFVMGFVDGETLTQRVRRQGPLTVVEAARLIQEVAWALSYAHGRGVVHRDVKPDNILIERATGRALVTDFGIARSAASGLTQVGETVGTPHFMSPEQASADVVDGRSDLYSLGVVAFYAVTGRLPFDGDSAHAILMMHLSHPAPPVSGFRPDLPPQLAAAIDRCLAKEPAQRFASGEEVVETLEGVRGRHVEVPPVIRIFTNKADQFARNALIIALFGNALSHRARNDLEQLVFLAIFLVVVVSLLFQIPLGMRDLARQGFGFADLVSGIRIIDEERAAASAAQRAAPGERKRHRRTLLILGLNLLIAVGLAALAIAGATPTAAGGYHVTSFGGIALFLSVVLALVTIVFFAAHMSRAGRAERRLHRLWAGKVGRILWRLGTRRLPMITDAARHSSPLNPGPLTVLESLPDGRRRSLSAVRRAIESLQQEQDACSVRERELQAAVEEAREAPDGVRSARQATLLEDLERARGDVVARRATITAGLENLRLALLRVKSGIGDVAGVERELAEIQRPSVPSAERDDLRLR